ncbi:MAG TPA: aminotransferase class I/II-fold pyridoxal phosphate-dependent enzyme [Candidatus Methylomirabilis sp.]|nr:aminotransferase class I/II-fold pyridoxal phosphate-dependent enzyme [Candidatus Methylomirabilis sp.]
MTDSIDYSHILHHLGEDTLPFNAVSPPIFQTSNFCFDSFESFQAALTAGERHLIYSRGNNPTVNLVEQKIAALEKAPGAKLVSAGVAAICASIMVFVKAGDHVICVKDCYSWTRRLLESYLPRFGVEHTFVEGSDSAEFERAIRPTTRVIFLESPTTFTFKLQDLARVSRIARPRGIKTVIDSTWGTPIFTNPLDFGIDLVVHSVSKYMGGHSDVIAGAVAGSEEDIERIFATEFRQLGTVPDPLMAWLVLRGLRTLQVRMQAIFEKTLEVARHLQVHPAVESVFYPFLESHPQYALVRAQMRGGGGLFSIRLKTRDLAAVKRFTNALRVFKRAVSWGGYESLAFPDAARYRSDPPEDRISLVRLYIGLEAKDILWSDLAQALEQLR